VRLKINDVSMSYENRFFVVIFSVALTAQSPEYLRMVDPVVSSPMLCVRYRFVIGFEIGIGLESRVSVSVRVRFRFILIIVIERSKVRVSVRVRVSIRVKSFEDLRMVEPVSSPLLCLTLTLTLTLT
jgi:hypothetical protein